MNDVGSAHKPRGWLLLCLSLLLVAVVYAPTLGAPFLWDDAHLVSSDTQERPFDFKSAFQKPFWTGAQGVTGSASYFRPLTTLSFELDRMLHGANPGGYHLTNVLVHLLVTGCAFQLLRRRQTPVELAFLLTTCWALLPRLTEGVAWVSGRGDVLAGAFALVALLVQRPGSRKRLALAAGFALGAVACKESGVAVFAALGLRELGPREGAKSPSSSGLPELALLALPLGLYGALRLSAGAISLGDGATLGAGMRAMTVLEALGRYAVMLVDVLEPRSFLGRLGHPSLPFVSVGVGLLLAAVGALASRKLRPPSLETLAFVALGSIPLLLVLHFTALPITVVAADRYLYLPSLGLLLAAAPTLRRLAERQRRLLVVPLLLAVACGVRASSRVADYTDDARFWAVAVADTPHEPAALVELGSVAYRAGCFPEALDLYTRAVQADDERLPRTADNIPVVATMLGRRELARTVSDQLVQRFPRVPSIQLQRAIVAINALDFEGAERYARRALELQPSFAQARSFLGLLRETRELWPGVVAGRVPPGVGITLELKILRYAEATAKMEALLEDPQADARALRSGIELMLAKGPPEVAERLLQAFLRLHAPPDQARMVEALNQRLATASNVRARLHELPTESH